MDDEVKRIIMKKRHSGPDYPHTSLCTSKKSMHTLWLSRRPMRWFLSDGRQEKNEINCSGSSGVTSAMLGKTQSNAFHQLREGAEEEPKLNRRSTHHGEWQRNHKTQDMCHDCGHTYCSGEDYDDSSLDSDEEERERRGPIACGYDITAAGKI